MRRMIAIILITVLLIPSTVRAKQDEIHIDVDLTKQTATIMVEDQVKWESEWLVGDETFDTIPGSYVLSDISIGNMTNGLASVYYTLLNSETNCFLLPSSKAEEGLSLLANDCAVEVHY